MLVEIILKHLNFISIVAMILVMSSYLYQLSIMCWILMGQM